MADAERESQITRMSTRDIDHVVQLQLDTLTDSLLTQLGGRFLHRFHEAAVRDPMTIGLVAKTSSTQLAGFAIGTTDGTRFRSLMRSRTLAALLQALATRPALLPKFALSVLQHEPSSPTAAELLLLAVRADYRRRHLATDLLAAFEERLRVAGLPGYRVAVRSWLKPAIDFYRSNGFDMEAEAIVLGAPMTYMRRRLPGHE